MTLGPWPPAKPWEVYYIWGRWPSSAGGTFLAEAARHIGRAMFVEWSDETLGWLHGGEQPFIPEARHVFTETGVDQRLYDMYQSAVRHVCSVGFFQLMELHKATMEEWLASMVPNPEGGEPLPAPQLRYQRGEDAGDPITKEHWHSAWLQAQLRQEEIDAARQYVPPIAAAIIRAAQVGALKTYARPFAGGQSVELPREAWEIDSAMTRLSWCALDPDRPRDIGAPATHWLFVNEADLAVLLSGTVQRSLLPELQPTPAELLTKAEQERTGASNVVQLHPPAKAPAVTECTAWLVERFDDPSTERMVKDQFKGEALERWRERLSARGFLMSWANAVAQRPERTRPGRRV